MTTDPVLTALWAPPQVIQAGRLEEGHRGPWDLQEPIAISPGIIGSGTGKSGVSSHPVDISSSSEDDLSADSLTATQRHHFGHWI